MQFSTNLWVASQALPRDLVEPSPLEQQQRVVTMAITPRLLAMQAQRALEQPSARLYTAEASRRQHYVVKADVGKVGGREGGQVDGDAQ